MIEFEEKLNKEQLKVVYEGDGPCLVLSGPGSGKTRTLVYRVAYLLGKNVPPNRILLLTFTKRAANEMISRINSLTMKKEGEVLGGTFHHAANFFLKKYFKKIDYLSNFIILDEEDSRSLISSIIKEKGKKDSLKAPVAQRIFSLSINSLKEIDEIIEDYFEYLDTNAKECALGIYKEYCKRKKENNLMDYDDLLLNWNNLLLIPEIREEISKQFEYILIDEYQDTNTLQNEIVKKISQAHGNILVVGDDSQSIYSFRAANIGNILNFPKTFKNSKLFKLELNYRSTPEILEVANRVIRSNTQKLEKNLKSTIKSGFPPAIVSFPNSSMEARFVYEKIKEKDLSKTAVLFRAHYHAVELEMELLKRNIPYNLRGGVRFFEQFHVKDIIAFLKIFLNFYDEMSWQRLLLRQEKIGEAGAKKIVKEIFKRKSMKEFLKEKEEIVSLIRTSTAKEKAKNFFLIIEEAQEKDTDKKINLFLSKFYNHFLDISFENSLERKKDIKKLIEVSEKYESDEKMISDFSLSEDYQKESPKGGAVTLSTIHQAKGLEWENVFIISLREGDFPHLKSLDENLLEEERRLFYVAVTRCKQNLFLTYSTYNFKSKKVSTPSRFIKETSLLKEESYPINDEEVVEDSDEWEFF